MGRKKMKRHLVKQHGVPKGLVKHASKKGLAWLHDSAPPRLAHHHNDDGSVAKPDLSPVGV